MIELCYKACIITYAPYLPSSFHLRSSLFKPLLDFTKSPMNEAEDAYILLFLRSSSYNEVLCNSD
jgi:hypothetical protein